MNYNNIVIQADEFMRRSLENPCLCGLCKLCHVQTIVSPRQAYAEQTRVRPLARALLARVASPHLVVDCPVPFGRIACSFLLFLRLASSSQIGWLGAIACADAWSVLCAR